MIYWFFAWRFLTIWVRITPKRFSEKILFLRLRHYGPKMAQNDQKWAQQQGYYHITRKLDDIWRNSEFWVRLPVLGPKILHFQNIGPSLESLGHQYYEKKCHLLCCEKWEIKNNSSCLLRLPCTLSGSKLPRDREYSSASLIELMAVLDVKWKYRSAGSRVWFKISPLFKQRGWKSSIFKFYI